MCEGVIALVPILYIVFSTGVKPCIPTKYKVPFYTILGLDILLVILVSPRLVPSILLALECVVLMHLSSSLSLHPSRITPVHTSALSALMVQARTTKDTDTTSRSTIYPVIAISQPIP